MSLEEITRIKGAIERNLKQAESDLALAANNAAESHSPAKDPAMSMKRRMAITMGKLVEDALFESLTRGETGMVDEITRILTRDFPNEKSE